MSALLEGIPPQATIFGGERAITSSRDDLLDRQEFVHRLASAVLNRRSMPTSGSVIAITGPWGSGKSSVLNLLEEHIRRRSRKAVVVRFDPWLVSNRDDLVRSFLETLQAAIASKIPEHPGWRKAVRLISQYADAISPLAESAHPVMGGLAKVLHKISGSEIQAAPTLRAKIEQQLAKVRSPIVVMIDELDRIEDSEVRTVAQLVRAIADFRGISYVLGFDHQRVIEALGASLGVTAKERNSRGKAYAEKIVHLAIPLPQASVEQRRSIIVELLDSSLGGNLVDQRFDLVLSLCLSTTILTPRDLKRAVDTYIVLHGMTQGEISAGDLFGYSSILIKSPETIEHIRSDPDLYVDDPASSAEQLNRVFRSMNNTSAEEEPFKPIDESITPLLKALFPAPFKEDRDWDSSLPPISKRRSLLIALRLGLVSSDVRRGDVLDLLRSSPAQVRDELRRRASIGEAMNLVDRIDELYGVVPTNESKRFWKGVSLYVLPAANDAPSIILNKREVNDNLGRTLRRRSKESKSSSATGVIIGLARDAEINLVSDFVRYHFFKYGLFGVRNEGSRFAHMTEEQTTQFAERVSKGWLNKIATGKFFDELLNMHAVYMLMDMGLWSNDCRTAFGSRLNDNEFVDRICLLMFGGSYVTSDNSIDKICGTKEFRRAVSRRITAVSRRTTQGQTTLLLSVLHRAREGFRD